MAFTPFLQINDVAIIFYDVNGNVIQKKCSERKALQN